MLGNTIVKPPPPIPPPVNILGRFIESVDCLHIGHKAGSFGILAIQPFAQIHEGGIKDSRKKIPIPKAIPGMAERPTIANINPSRVYGNDDKNVRQNCRNWFQQKTTGREAEIEYLYTADGSGLLNS